MRFSSAQGKILCYQLFDIADEINLERLRTQWEGQKQDIQIVSRRSAPYYLQFATSPLLLPLGEKVIQLSEQLQVRAQLSAKVFTFGVISFTWEFPLPEQWQDLVDSSEIYIDNTALFQTSKVVLEELAPILNGVCIDPYAEALTEDYTIFYIQQFHPGKTYDAPTLMQELGGGIARLLRGESRTLSQAEQALVLSEHISYYEDDLVVVAWNSAFVYDPENSQDHIDMLEFAHAELLELRSYDALLDKELAEVYDEIAALSRRRALKSVFTNPYHFTTQRLLNLFLEFTELSDKIENVLKIIGELYSARIYRMMSRQLYLQDWHRRVDGKLENARQIYESLNTELENHRLYVLEMTIVVLIAIEIILIFTPFTH